MLISFVIIFIIALSGLILTHLFLKEETILWRLAAGTVLGSAVFGLVTFIAANAFGFSFVPVIVSLTISSAPMLLLRNKNIRLQLKHEWQRAKDKTQGFTIKKLRRLSYYAFFFVLFVMFFDRAMIVSSDGIFTGASQNLGDLPFHLGAVLSFTEGNNFPPQNPSFAGVKFSYPFMVDFITGCFMKLGAGVQSSMFVLNVSWAFSLLILFERFVALVTNSRTASKFASLLLFFSGGLGFLWFFKDFWYGSQGLFEFLSNLPRDYTIGKTLRWGNTMTTLLVTQRSLLLGMPLTIIVLSYLWSVLVDPKGWIVGHKRESDNKKDDQFRGSAFDYTLGSFFLVGIFTGMLPLIHGHSLLVLFIVSGFWFFKRLKWWKNWIAYAAGVSVIAIPELAWILSGSATDTRQFFAWHFGWDHRGDNIFWFWFKNTGLFLPLLVTGSLWAALRSGNEDAAIDDESESTTRKTQRPVQPAMPGSILALLFPFVFIFVVSNILRLAPWEWDNIKLLIYWYIGSIPVVSLVLASLWQRGRRYQIGSAVCVIILTFSGALDIWRVTSAQTRFEVFDKDAVEIAGQINNATKTDALILNAPTYNSAAVLSGRRSLMRYVGHLSSHGIDYSQRERDLKNIYAGTATADLLLRKHGVDYVLVSPEERRSFPVNEQYFEKYPIAAEVGEYKVYKVK